MNKIFEAALRGYFLFEVNGRRFRDYGSALAARDAVPESEDVFFYGLHVVKGWRGFYLRVHQPKWEWGVWDWSAQL